MPKRSRFAFRTGQLDSLNRRPPVPADKVVRCEVSTKGTSFETAVSGTKGNASGVHWVIALGDYNIPTYPITFNGMNESLNVDSKRHPTGHEEAVADGYDTYLVLSQFFNFLFKCNVHSITQDYVVAYKFSTDSSLAEPDLRWAGTAISTTPTHPAPDGYNNKNAWLDMQMSGGWVYKHKNQNLNAGGGYTRMKINIPNLPLLTAKMHEYNTTTFTMDDMQGPVNDNASPTVPVIQTYLHICIIQLQEAAYAADLTTNTFTWDMTCQMKVKLMKGQGLHEMLDEADAAG